MLIKVKVFPAAKEADVVEKDENSYEVYVRAKPVRGQANREIVEALAAHFKIPMEKIHLVRGFKQRNKIFVIK